MPKTRQSFGEATLYSFYCVNVLFQHRWPNYGVVLRQRSDINEIGLCANYGKVVFRETKDRWIWLARSWALITIASIYVNGNKLCVTRHLSHDMISDVLPSMLKFTELHQKLHYTKLSIQIISCHELAHSAKASKAHCSIALSLSFKTRT